MELADRLLAATGALFLLYTIGLLFFAIARSVAVSCLKSLGTDRQPALLVWGVILYPAIVVYGFVLNTMLGLAILVPAVVLALLPELLVIGEKGEPAVGLPDTVTLTEPVRVHGSGYRTRVMIDGEYWTAEISGGATPIVGQQLRVIGRSGTTIRLSAQ